VSRGTRQRCAHHSRRDYEPAVIRPSGNVHIHLYRPRVDLRKAINGLVALVEGEMDHDPFSADLFLFCNRNRTLVKMVGWKGNGFVLWMKRLEKSRFKWPLSESGAAERNCCARRHQSVAHRPKSRGCSQQAHRNFHCRHARSSRTQ
jgi:transposase